MFLFRTDICLLTLVVWSPRFLKRPAKNSPPSEGTGEPVFRAYNYIANLEQTMCAPFGMALLRNWNTVIPNYNNVRIVYEFTARIGPPPCVRARGPLDARWCDGLFSADVLRVCIRARNMIFGIKRVRRLVERHSPITSTHPRSHSTRTRASCTRCSRARRP